MEILDEPAIVQSSRLKSLVWNDFDRIKKGDTFVAICKHCKKKLSGSSSSGTSHLRNHLVRCKRRSNNDIAQFFVAREKKKPGSVALVKYQQKKDEKPKFGNGRCNSKQPKDAPIVFGNVNFNQKQSEIDLARMIILHGYPLDMVEHAGFQMFVKDLQPLFDIPTINRIEFGCREIYEKEKQKVYEVLDKLPGKISLGCDKWTALEGDEYLCLTAHFIDETWQLQKKILNFITLHPSYTEGLLSEFIMTCLMEWDIDRKLFSMTVDFGSGSDNIVYRIRERLCQNRFLLCNGQLFDVRCAASVLNLMVLDILEASGELLDKIRGSIRYVKSSQMMHQNFNDMAQQVGVDCEKCLSLDNPFQWDGTYFMLEAALQYRSVFLLLQEHDPAYSSSPSDTEWERMCNIACYLKLFFEVSNAFTCNNCPIANLYFPEICNIHLQLVEWSKNPDDFLSGLAWKMKTKFDEFWRKCSLALAAAAVLDPRIKMKSVEYYYPQIYGSDAPEHIDDVSGTIRALYNEHAICSPLASFDEGLTCQVSSSDGLHADYSVSAISSDTRDRLTGYDQFLHETSHGLSVVSDLDKYLEEPLFPRSVDFDILEWWHVHSSRYPILSMMARNILGIPMSKVSSKSAFDTRSILLDPHWSSLGSGTLQILMCAQDWLQNVVDCKSPSSHSTLTACPDMF